MQNIGYSEVDEPFSTVASSKKQLLRRNRVLAIAAAAVLLTLILGIAGTAWQSRVAKREAAAARKAEAEQRRLAGLDCAARNDALQNSKLAEDRLVTSTLLEAFALKQRHRPGAARGAYIESLFLTRKLGRSEIPIWSGWIETSDVGIPLQGRDGERAGVEGFFGDQDAILSVALSADGHLALSGDSSSGLKLWDTTTGRKILEFVGHTGNVASVAFSPDGTEALSGGSDGTIRIWDIHSGKELQRLADHQGEIWAVAFSPDGHYVLSGGVSSMKMWDVSAAKEIRTFVLESGRPAHAVKSVAFSADGRTIASAHLFPGYVRIWDASTGKLSRSLMEVKDRSNAVISVAFAPDGRTVAGGYRRSVKIWDISTGKVVRSRDGIVAVPKVAFSRDGQLILFGGGSNEVNLWDASTGANLRTCLTDLGQVTSIALSRDARMALVGYGRHMGLKLWDLSAGKEICKLSADGRTISKVMFSADERLALSSGSGKAVLWDLATGKELRRFLGPSTAAISADGTRLWGAMASGLERRGMVKMWDVATRKELQSIELGDSDWTFIPEIMCFSPDARMLATCDLKRTLELWNIAGAKASRKLLGIGTQVSSAVFSPDDLMLLAGNMDGSLNLWDISAGNLIYKLIGHTEDVCCVAISNDGRRALSGGKDRTVRLWDLVKGKEIYSLVGHEFAVTSVAFTPDGRMAFSGGQDGLVTLWDLSTGKEVRSLPVHTSGVKDIACSASGAMLLTGGEDGVAKLWNFSTMDRCLVLEKAVVEGRKSLDKNGNDARALAGFGEWWAFRGMDDWALELFERAERNGAKVPALTIARCNWTAGRLPEAKREFERALSQKQDLQPYLMLCIDAVQRELSGFWMETWESPAGALTWRCLDEHHWELTGPPNTADEFQVISAIENGPAGATGYIVRKIAQPDCDVFLPKTAAEGSRAYWRALGKDNRYWNFLGTVHPGYPNAGHQLR